MRVRIKQDRLANELARRHLSLRAWGRRLNLKSGHLSQLANGKRKFPDPETRRKLQEGLSVEFDDLFEVIA